MSFRDFTFPEVAEQLGLTLSNERLFAGVPPLTPRPVLVESLALGVQLARGIDTEKARSEFVIAPILLEFFSLRKDKNSVFSGVEFNVDAAAGLTGYCDFLITRSPMQFSVTAPVIAVAEAKNDNVRHGLGQCIAGMRAAWLFNADKGSPVTQVYGASTTGTHWEFLRLRDREVTLDEGDYFVSDVGKILGILNYMVDTA